MSEYAYRVHLVVELTGPDAPWEEVAQDTAWRVERLRERNGYRIVSANVDRAAEPSEEAS